MRLDHVSYVTTHEQISDTVQRIGSLIGTAFVDGGIHPQFGTRNFTAPLLNGQYIEIVCALDHPAAEQTAFGQAVSKKAAEGGGWLTWVFSTDDLAAIEAVIGRPAIRGHRRRPDGNNLEWKQVGISDLVDSRWSPFFISWLTGEHPSRDGNPAAELNRINLNLDRIEFDNFVQKFELYDVTRQLIVCSPVLDENLTLGIGSVAFEVGNREVIID